MSAWPRPSCRSAPRSPACSLIRSSCSEDLTTGVDRAERSSISSSGGLWPAPGPRRRAAAARRTAAVGSGAPRRSRARARALALRQPFSSGTVAMLSFTVRRGEQAGLLDHVADAPPQRRQAGLRHLVPVQQDRDPSRLDQPVDHAQRGRLAVAAGPDQDHDLPVGNLQAEIIDRDGAARVALRHMLKDDHVFRMCRGVRGGIRRLTVPVRGAGGQLALAPGTVTLGHRCRAVGRPGSR
jgi:hypothetical protein